MAYGMYLVVAPGAALDELADNIRDRIGGASGDPLAAVGANRGLVPAAVAQALADAQPGTSVTDQLMTLGAESAEPVTTARAAELMRSREPTELALERGDGSAALVRNGIDWHLARTRLADAWSLVGGRDHIDWEGILVGQIDTGFTQHPALGFVNGTPAWIDSDRDANYFYAETWPEPGSHEAPAPMDSALDPLTGPNGGHGTRTATVLAGHDPAQSYYGAAPRVPVLPVRLSNCIEIGTDIAGLHEAIAHLIDIGGCDVITMSMGTAPGGMMPEARRELRRAYDNGIIVCCAAGNYAPFVVVPARERYTIAVAGSAPNDEPWSGSSCGPQVDISAPAWPIRRGNAHRNRDAPPTYDYGYGDGTSFATPQVAAAAALWLARHRGRLRSKYPQNWMRVEAFKRLLKRTADTVGGAWDTESHGAGILDARALLEASLPNANTLEREEDQA
ncbi:MAG: S8 family serine peptidase [Burkholderiales bacterium]